MKAETDSSDMLVRIWEVHGKLQESYIGAHPSELQGEERIWYFKDMTIASTDEAHEALNEIGWKPWASSRHFNEGAVQGELIDELHFLLNRMMAARMSPERVFEMYMAKNAVNFGRIASGYDGVNGKCSGCKRALDDPSTKCYIKEMVGTPWCVDHGWRNADGSWQR